MTKRQAKKVYRRWLRGTPYDSQGNALPPYHSLTRYRRTTFRRAARIVGREELRHFSQPTGGCRRWWKWEPYDAGDVGESMAAAP